MADTAAETYAVVLLIEQALTPADAARVRSLHESIEEPVAYHVLLPVEDAAARIESAMGSLSSNELMGSPTLMMHEVDLDAVRDDARDRSQTDLARTLEALRIAGATAEGELVDDPVKALQSAVARYDGREAIILTRPHVIAEFFHVDWTAQARRHLDVPVLHLLEHETFDEQAGEGEGINGM
ncbi:hypothetical protein AB3X52_15450 [Nocardioides sp. DS6]|uniref:Indole-3-glycerol phosphate synthase n=1 Tax=Nocardioides eburneus TaxID=3231482 RepID=A0ABV3T1E6_9ACTN